MTGVTEMGRGKGDRWGTGEKKGGGGGEGGRRD